VGSLEINRKVSVQHGVCVCSDGEMIRMDHIHVHSDGKNEMDGLRMCMWSAAGSNTFAGVLEVVELDVDTVKQSMECEGPCGLGRDS